jgi:hypothetical protein
LLYWPNVYIPHCGGPFFFERVWVLYRFQQYFDSAFTKLLFSFSDVLKTTHCTFQEVDNIFCLAVGIAVYDDFFSCMCAAEFVCADHNPKWDDKSRPERESFWIRKLKTLSPNGINEKK